MKEEKIKLDELSEDFLEQLDDYLYNCCQELVCTPFFMFKYRWKLTAKIETTKAIISFFKQLNRDFAK